jgi:hypothetical protein
MNEFRRLRDDSESVVELLLLEAGADYRSTADARAKTLAALGLAGSAALSAGAVGVATSSLFGKLGWAKVLMLSGLGVAVVAPVGYVTWHRFHKPVPSAHVAVVAPRPQTVAAAPVRPESAPADTPALLPPADAAPVKAEARVAPASALAAELGALDGVRSALKAGDETGALARLDDYARVYPRGRLVLEAEVLRMEALARSGQSTLAKKRAQVFLRKHPNSVLASRVRGYLGE